MIHSPQPALIAISSLLVAAAAKAHEGRAHAMALGLWPICEAAVTARVGGAAPLSSRAEPRIAAWKESGESQGSSSTAGINPDIGVPEYDDQRVAIVAGQEVPFVLNQFTAVPVSDTAAWVEVLPGLGVMCRRWRQGR